MTHHAWKDRPHKFREDVDDASMCVCGVPVLTHECMEPGERELE